MFHEYFKKKVFVFIRGLMRSSLFRKELFTILEAQYETINNKSFVNYSSDINEYPELDFASNPPVYLRDDIIFVTARFRSGSTFLWNIFRNIPNCTAYYEPLLHESPRKRGVGRDNLIDPTHRGVMDYHSEFKNIDGLEKIHTSDWAFKKLFMNESSFDPDLEKYINILIEKAPGRPILQFNRVDFRLQWLKFKYPNAKILHLFRNPRNQWMSMIKNDGYIPKEFKWDKNELYPPINTFYLWDWWKDLHIQMPFLELKHMEHPYQIHYLIWRASYLFGKEFADYSVSYEALVGSFETLMPEIIEQFNISDFDLNKLVSLKGPNPKKTWINYADESWFQRMERNAESLLSRYFR